MSTVHRSHMHPSGVTIEIAQGDLTQEPLDGIVNAANEMLAHGGGIAGMIARRGGPAIQQESDAWVRQHGPVTHAQPAWTSAGHLPGRIVIHAVGPVWGSGQEDRKLTEAVQGVLRTAENLGLSSIGMPAISTGIFGFPKERAARIMLQAVSTVLDQAPYQFLRLVRLVLFDEETLRVFVKEFDRQVAD